MVKGVITYNYKNRVADHIAKAMLKMKLYKTDGYYPITDNDTGKEIAAFVCVYGNRFAVRFLEWITDYRGKDRKLHIIEY